MQLFKKASLEISYTTTTNVDNRFWTSQEILESIDEVKMMRKFYSVCIISLNFEVYSLQFLQEVFLLSFKATIYIFGFKKQKVSAKYLKLFWFQVFRPLSSINYLISA